MNVKINDNIIMVDIIQMTYYEEVRGHFFVCRTR